MTGTAENDRQRKHREKWMKELLDGLDRIHSVLHSQNAALEEIRAELSGISRTMATKREPVEEGPAILSVKGAAEYLGVSVSTVRTMTAGPEGAPAVLVGRNRYYKRSDLDLMIERLKEVRPQGPGFAYRVNPIGSNVPSTSDLPPKVYCAGSGQEPSRLSRWPGRGRCPVCRDEPMLKQDGRLRKHRPY